MKCEWTVKALSDLQALTADFEHPKAAARVMRRLTAVPDVLVTFPHMGTLLGVVCGRGRNPTLRI